METSIHNLLSLNELLASGVNLIGSLVTVFFVMDSDTYEIYEDNKGLVVNMGMDMIGNQSMVVLGSDGQYASYSAYNASKWYIKVVSEAQKEK
tara:strand:- start:361 stop:639 length:279 start_codon:yes stop_codon:yes gene_type:complete